MSLSDSALPTSVDEQASDRASALSESHSSMQDYYALQHELFVTTIVLSTVIFATVWGVYSLSSALSYLLGSCVGIVYLRLLAKSVERIGEQNKRRGSPPRLALFVGLVIVALQWNQLQFMPVFLGFLTYKAALIVYTLRITVVSSKI